MSRDVAHAQGKSADRPDGAPERLVRIETRLVKYQQANALAMESVAAALAKLTKQGDDIARLLQEVINNGED